MSPACPSSPMSAVSLASLVASKDYSFYKNCSYYIAIYILRGARHFFVDVADKLFTAAFIEKLAGEMGYLDSCPVFLDFLCVGTRAPRFTVHVCLWPAPSTDFLLPTTIPSVSTSSDDLLELSDSSTDTADHICLPFLFFREQDTDIPLPIQICHPPAEPTLYVPVTLALKSDASPLLQMILSFFRYASTTVHVRRSTVPSAPVTGCFGPPFASLSQVPGMFSPWTWVLFLPVNCTLLFLFLSWSMIST